MSSKPVPIGRLAVEKGFITEEQLSEALQEHNVRKAVGSQVPLGQVLVELELLTRVQLEGLLKAQGLASQPKRQPLPGYELIKKLGEGGMAATYLARQTSMDRLVAIKIMRKNLSKDSQFVERFGREAKLAGSLNHVNIVSVHDVGAAEGFHYLAMEYVEGRSAYDLLPESGAMDEALALRITLQVARALDYAHRHGIIHRDIKPENILVTREQVAKVCDFGLARSTASETRVTQTGTMMGTPHYVSPEQARGERDVDIRSDIYSLGATLYHLVTGEPPFQGSSAAVVMTKHLNEELPWPQDVNPSVSDNVCRLIERMMAKDPGNRYQTPAEAIADLELVIDGRAPGSRELGTGQSLVAKKGHSEVRPGLRRKPARHSEDAGTAGRILEPVGSGKRFPAKLLLIFGSAAVALAAVVLAVTLRGGNSGESGTDLDAAAKSAWETGVIPRIREKPTQEEALALREALTVFRVKHGETAFGQAKREELELLKARAEEALAGPETPPPAVTDEKLKGMYEVAEDLWKKHPEDFTGATSRFQAVKSSGAGTKWALLAEEAIRQVGAAREKAVDAEFGGRKGEAGKLAAAGDYDAALAALEKPSEKFAELLAERLKTEQEALRKEAAEKLGTALSGAEKLSAEGKPAEGLAELDKVAGVKYAALADRLAALRTRLEDEKKNVAEQAKKRRLAEAYRQRDAILDGFDERMLSGQWKEAGEHVAAERRKLSREALLPEVTAQLAAAEAAAGQLAGHEAARAGALRKLAGKVTDLRSRDGVYANCKIVRVHENAFDIEYDAKFMGEKRRVGIQVSFKALAEGELDRLLPPFEPKGGDGQVAVLFQAAARKDFDAAGRALAAAGGHVLAGRYKDRLEVWQLGEDEAAAKRAWAARVAPLAKEKPALEEAKKLQAALDEWTGVHGKTKWAEGKKAEIETLRAAVAAAIAASPEGLTARVEKLFKGKVVKFDPETMGIELLYDFEDVKQLEDFEILAGDWKIEGGVLVGQADLGGWGIIARPRVRLGPECRVSASGAVRQGHSMFLKLGLPPDWVTMPVGFYAYRGEQNRRVELFRGTERRGHRAMPDIQPGSSYPMELVLSGWEVSAKFAGQDIGREKGVPHRQVRVALGVSHAHVQGSTVAAFDDLCIVGLLDRNWPEAELKRRAACEALRKNSSVFRAEWRELRINGDKPAGRGAMATAMTYDSKRRVNVLFGGSRAQRMNDLWILDLAARRWTCLQKNDLQAPSVQLGTRPGGCGEHLFEYDSGNDLYWVGGDWAYQPGAGVWRKAPKRPNGYVGGCRPGSAYDPDGKRFARCSWEGNPAPLGCCFICPATNVVERPPNAAIPPRSYLDGGLVYDRRNKVFVLFGGVRAGNSSTKAPPKWFDDTWVLEPPAQEWRLARPTASPPARERHKLIWHDTLGAIVMFGREPAYGQHLEDLWVYETAADRWTEVKTPTTPSCSGATCYDASQDLLVLFNQKGQTWVCKIERDEAKK